MGEMSIMLFPKLSIYMQLAVTESLGPYKRYAIWVQGCEKRCKGCIAKDAWALDGGEIISINNIAEQIIAQTEIEGITISGGEPFLQQEALCELIKYIKKKRDLGVIIYTGMKFEDVKNAQLTSLCDLIIDGEYIESLNDGLSLRGSSNQNVVNISDRYVEITENYFGCPGRRVEFVFRDGRIDMIGIPPKKLDDQIN